MKFLLTLFLTLSSFLTISQPMTLPTYKNYLGKWNSFSEKFDFTDSSYSTIKFTIKDDYILADDEAHSLYRISKRLPEKEENGVKFLTAVCLDEKNRTCLFTLVYKKVGINSNPLEEEPDLFIMIIYPQAYCYMYIIDVEKIKL